MLVFQESTVNGYLDPELTVSLHKELFTLIANINSHNNRLWWSTNPLAFCEVSA